MEFLTTELMPEQIALDDVTSQQCAAYVYSRLLDEQERLVIRLSFELDLKPAEIARLYPIEFSSAQDVSRIKERVIRRLSEDPILRIRYGIEN